MKTIGLLLLVPFILFAVYALVCVFIYNARNGDWALCLMEIFVILFIVGLVILGTQKI